jgi:hypothetical protein
VAGGGLKTRDQAPLRDGSRHRGPCAGPCGWEGGSGCDKHAVIPMAMPGRWDQRPPAGRGTPRMRGRAPFARRLDHLFTARCPCRAPGRARQGRALALSSEFFPSAGLGADPGVHGEACPELVETPPHGPHWRISAAASGVMSPGRAKRRSSYDTSQFSKRFSPSRTAPHPYYQRCWTPGAVPPPITQGQPLSVGLSSCGMLRASGDSWGFLRTSGIGFPPRSGPSFALSRWLFS